MKPGTLSLRCASVWQLIEAYVGMIALHCLKPSQSSRCAIPKEIVKWTPPLAGLLCLNVDAAIFSSSSSLAVGVVVRDHLGKCLMGCH